MLASASRLLVDSLASSFSLGSQLRYASGAASKLQVCIVGSGPAGMYTANRLLKALGDDVNIGIVDRLPTPFGLVRSGVAPDHPETKNVINGFSADAADPRCAFFGNVQVGKSLSIAQLRQLFHCVVLAYGAESDRRLGIPGEDLKGVFAAREFVWWYNGHPDARSLPLDLSQVESVAVCGLGNVALDCARLLLRPTAELASTDVAEHALMQLRNSKVKQVSIIARRGPIQAACTPKELKELLQCTGVSAHVDPDVLTNLSAEDQADMKSVRLKRRIHEILQQNCKPLPAQAASRQLHFRFFQKPVEVVGDDQGRVCGLQVEKTKMVKRADGSMAAEGTGEIDTIRVQLVLKSIGYKSLPLDGVPFDSRAGVIPNVAGRVSAPVSAEPTSTPAGNSNSKSNLEASNLHGLYVVGWLKRGPTGIIGTNLADAQDTVSSITSDLPDLTSRYGNVVGVEGLRRLLSEQGVAYVDWEKWRKLDGVEVERGHVVGKPREKIASVTEMMQACLGDA